MRLPRNNIQRALLGLLFFLSVPVALCRAIPAPPHPAGGCSDCHHPGAMSEDGTREIPGVIKPEGSDPHRVLLNTCMGCHPDGVPAFWMLTFPRKRLETPPPAAPGGITFKNPHDEMACADCHRAAVSFDKPADTDRQLLDSGGDLSDFCLRCHSGTPKTHYPNNNLPLGNITCLTCHKAHRPTTLAPALRGDFFTFVRETRGFNPHGGEIYCLVCHPNRPVGRPEFVTDDLNRLCIRCHPGMDHHVIARPSSKKNTWKLDFLSYPLFDGKVACITCHAPHGMDRNAPGFSRYFLRGEPYEKLTDFCDKCHEGRGWESLNAHDQLTPAGDIITRSCLLCHVSAPDTASGKPLGAADFNSDLTAICLRCHEELPHPEAPHLVKPDRAMQTDMRAYEERREVRLPLDFDRRITCVTCHNPHEKGLLKGPDSVGADEYHRLRLANYSEICTPCHGKR